MTTDPISGLASNTPATGSLKSKQKFSEDFDNFLKLLTTQLQNQDPTAPIETNEFTNQIVSFSQLEQTVGINDNLEKLLTSNNDLGTNLGKSNESILGSINSLVALSKLSNPAVFYVGKTIEASGNLAEHKPGQPTSMTFMTAEKAVVSTITIKNSAGVVVATDRINNVDGRHEYKWNGKNSAGADCPEGVYTFSVSSTGLEGPVETATVVSGKVTGAQFTNGDTLLEMGKIYVPIGSISSIRDTPTTTTTASN
jgi:flagellar basal-body rod modification protein FlgD